MSQIHTIHEFSTGIEPERTAQGGWISRGFTGRWMNSTLPQIPDAVEQAIRNKEFAAKTGSSLNPAIIGRVVRGNNHDYWSVVAVVIRGGDETRPFTAYRYFLCEGKDNLYLIVGWLNDKTKHTRIPIFDPFQQGEKIYLNEEDTQKYRNDANHYDHELSNSNQLTNYYRQPPVILKEKQYQNIQIIDRLANKIAQDKGSLVSWSYNVDALEKPERFLIIQPASQEAYNRLQSLERPPSATVEITNESELKSAIQGLIRLENIRVNLKTIENILDSFKYKDIENYTKYFHKFFDELGAKEAYKEKFYDVGMMELLTLRAILLPETLVEEYISYAYLHEKPNKVKKDSPTEKSLVFQEKLYKEIKALSNSLPNIKLKLRDGLFYAVEQFWRDTNNISITTLFWLIKNTQSVWYLGSQELLDSIRQDLNNIYEFYKTGKIRQLQIENTIIINPRLWKELINYYWTNKINLPNYKPLNDLFLELEEYDLAYYFSVVTNGKYTEKVFEKLPKDTSNIFGIPIPKRHTQSTSQTTSENHNVQDGSGKGAEIINVILYIILLALVLVVRLEKDIIVTFIFAVIASVFFALYVTDVDIRAIIKKHSLPLVMLAFLLGNLGNVISYKQLKGTSSTSNSVKQSQILRENGTPPVSNSGEAWLDNAINSFTEPGKTLNAIEQIIFNLRTDQDLIESGFQFDENDYNLISEFKNEISFKGGYVDIINSINTYPNDTVRKREKLTPLLKAIYNYQAKRGIKEPDGIINVDINKNPKSTMSIVQNSIKARIKKKK